MTSPDLAAPVAPVDESAPTPPRYQVGDRLPLVLDLKQLGAVLGLSPARIFTLYQHGEFDFALIRPTVGNKPRFSGQRIQAWSAGEDVQAGPPRRPHFGRGR